MMEDLTNNNVIRSIFAIHVLLIAICALFLKNDILLWIIVGSSVNVICLYPLVFEHLNKEKYRKQRDAVLYLNKKKSKRK